MEKLRKHCVCTHNKRTEKKQNETGTPLTHLQTKEQCILTKCIPFLQRYSLFDPTPSILKEIIPICGRSNRHPFTNCVLYWLFGVFFYLYMIKEHET